MKGTDSARIPWATWRPKLFEMLAPTTGARFAADLIAGLTVGVVACRWRWPSASPRA